MIETRALTLPQPTPSLVALNVVTILTSARPTRFRGRLLIHAGATKPDGGSLVGTWAIGAAGMSTAVGGLRIESLPLGAIVASCTLADVVPMVTPEQTTEWVLADLAAGGRTERRYVVDTTASHGGSLRLIHDDLIDGGCTSSVTDLEDQRPYGDFAPGRFAWLLEDVKPTTERCPACWGSGWRPDSDPEFPDCCLVCSGAGVCDPVPAKGRPGLWIQEWAS